MESFFPPIIPVDPAGNSLLRCTVRTSGPADAVAAVFPLNAAGLGADAGDIVVWTPVLERRLRRGALRNCERASRMKSAAGRWIQRARNRTGNRLQAAMAAAVHAGNRFEQSAGVRVERISKQLRTRRLLHHARRVENRHVVGVLGDDSEV